MGIKHNRAFQYEMIDMFHSTVGLNGTQRYDEQGNPLYLRFSTAHLIINPTHQAFPNENEWGRGLKLKQSQYDLSGSVYFHMGGRSLQSGPGAIIKYNQTSYCFYSFGLS